MQSRKKTIAAWTLKQVPKSYSRASHLTMQMFKNDKYYSKPQVAAYPEFLKQMEHKKRKKKESHKWDFKCRTHQA